MSHNFGQMDLSDKGNASKAMSINIVPNILSSTNTQSAKVDLLPKFYSPIPVSISPYPYNADFSREQAARLGILSNIQAPTSVYMGFPHLPSGASLPAVGMQNLMPVSTGLQISNSKKRPAQRQGPVKLQSPAGISQLSSVNKRPSQSGPPPKVQTELFESVRSKLRESLAASLAMVVDQENKSPTAEVNSPKVSVTMAPTSNEKHTNELVEFSTTTSKPSATGNCPEVLASNVTNTSNSDCQDVPSDPDTNRNVSDQTEPEQDDGRKDSTTNAMLENEMPSSDSPVMNDELLQGHGLCWASDGNVEIADAIMDPELKRPKLSHEEIIEGPNLLAVEVTGGLEESIRNTECLATKDEGEDSLKEALLQKADTLATRIEAELFKLFGGVNKKYKEKARSLLFNLKDRSNPELRERVLNGDIAPERLCAMTAEELASKELSEWRLAKAEEMAQMVVLPDSDLDMRRLVKKNHKGEFQIVEVEQDDIISAEVAMGGSVLSRVPLKDNGGQSPSKTEETEIQSMSHETKPSEGFPLPEKGDSGQYNASGNLDSILHEKADFMQDLIVDELKDTELLLPPIVSLDEFMEALDTEPPFDNISMGANLSHRNSDSSEPEMDTESDNSEPKQDSASDHINSVLDSSKDISGPELSLPATDTKASEQNSMDDDRKFDVVPIPDTNMKSSSGDADGESRQQDIFRSIEGHIWEGALQINISTLANVFSIFKSGEKTSTQEWPSLLDIKGRVRLDAFEKFLQELPLSRSRAIMIAQFCWKDEPQGSSRDNIIEVATSYLNDQRVGFAEPAAGVELYLCPADPKATEMLERHLPKEYTESLRSTVDGLIGVVVWRRPHVTTISPRLSSHHRHGGSKRQSSSRRQTQNVSNSSFNPSRFSSTHSKSNPSDEVIDDVPPGFGPGNSRDEDDLPEFDFHSSSQQKGVVGAPANSRTPALPPAPARPVEQMRELIHRYGQGGDANKSFDDDDIPEWQPQQNNPPPQQQQLPPLPVLPLPLPQQQPLPPQQYLMNQNLMQPQPQLQQQLIPMGMQMPTMLMQPQFNPQMGFMQGQQPNMNMNANPLCMPGGPLMSMPVMNNSGMMMQPCHLNFTGQPVGPAGQPYGLPAGFTAMPMQNGGMMAWRPPDVPRNS